MKCFFCKGPAHPACGSQYSENVVVCGNCSREFYKWMIPFVNGKGRRRGYYFYEHVKGPEK